MQGIVDPLNGILARLAAMDTVNKDGAATKLYTRVWNNQIRYEEDGQLYNFPKPAAFVEIASPVQFQVLGQGFRSADLAIRVHLSTEEYNSEGNFEQDLAVFALRDKVIGWLTNIVLQGCSPLVSIGESQDFEHRNTYHYIVDFVCNFTDTKGSRLDEDKYDAFKFTTPPTELELDVTVDKKATGPVPGIGYVIPGRK